MSKSNSILRELSNGIRPPFGTRQMPIFAPELLLIPMKSLCAVIIPTRAANPITAVAITFLMVPPSGFVEIVSDDFPSTLLARLLLIVQNRLRCGFAHFKLGTHFL